MNLEEDLLVADPDKSPDDSVLGDESDVFHSAYVSTITADQPRRPIDKLLQIPNTKVSISIAENRITLELSGEVSGHIKCDRFMNSDMFIVESSRVDKGYGPLLYDIAMEEVTNQGCSLASDRKRVSNSAFAVWKYYYENRPDVQKKKLDVGLWYMGNRSEEHFKNMTEDPATWPDKKDPIWSLWHGYQKTPDILPMLKEHNRLEVHDVKS